MAKAKKPTRNTTAQYTAKEPRVRYIYDAGDNRRAMSRQPKAVADEIIRVAVNVVENGELLEVTQVSGHWNAYYLEDFEKSGGEDA